jgi:hypothetical protein
LLLYLQTIREILYAHARHLQHQFRHETLLGEHFIGVEL